MSNPLRILIAENDERVARFLEIELGEENYEATLESNGAKALERIQGGGFSLVILDVDLPDLDGFAIVRRVRESADIPIIFLTDHDSVEDKVRGLDLGADDYMTKPFAMEELFARIRNALRRHMLIRRPPIDEKIVLGDIIMYPTRYEVLVADAPIHLTRKEFALLEYLLRNKRRVLTRDQILQHVWGYDYVGDTNIVDVYIRYLRSKIDERTHTKYIYTVRGVGYVAKEEQTI